MKSKNPLDMKIITLSILAIILLGCQAEPELENSCDCEGETVQVADKYIGTVYLDDFYHYGIALIYSEGKIRVKPCEVIDSTYLYEGSQLIVSGDIKKPCFPGAQPSSILRARGYYPIEIKFIEPVTDISNNQ